ncbi:MAG: sulfurtransferase TusA family protein [Bacillota bacterium]|nr:sulfurtransferase TusA family protein [Bacillota bacterium]
MADYTVDREIDARGSFCPGPMMELMRAIRSAQVGEVIAILSTDQGSRKDIPAWARKAGHEFLGVETVDGYDRIAVRKRK